MIPSHPSPTRSPSFARVRALIPAVGLTCLAVGVGVACSAGPSTTTTTGAGGNGGHGGATGTGGVTSSSSSGSGGATTSSSSSGSGGGTTSSSSGNTGGSDAGPPCTAGTILCEGTVEKVCDGNGGFTTTLDCQPQLCAPGVGCVSCIPGTGKCTGQTSMICKPDGTGYTSVDCDPDQGLTCDAVSGACSGPCAAQVIGKSYIGCDYYPTVTANVVSENPFHFAVSVSNTSVNPANVKVTQGAAVIATATVAPASVAIITLPWVSALKNSYSSTEIVPSGAYRLRSDQPVSVYQYNPLEYTLGGQFSYTNDASILLPVSVWTGNYRVSSWPTLSTGLPGFYAVVASENGTTVHLTAPPTGGTASAGAGVDAAGNGTVTLNQGDVIQVFSGGSGANGDLTGSLVAADKPVQVIGGHVCTYLPDPVCCCDHIEESVPPLETVGNEYMVTAPLITAGSTPVQEVVRILATADNTTLVYDPPQPGAPASIATAGSFVQLTGTAADFKVSANAKILVSQFMEGEQNVGSGDPAMTLAVPIQQYRKVYLFHAPVTYQANFVNVTAPTGATVTIDGQAVSGFTPIGGSGFAVARVSLSNAGNGTHAVLSAVPVGISVYGYGEYTSYWYPGGQDLAKL